MSFHRFYAICILSLLYALSLEGQSSYHVTPINYKDGQSLGYTRDVIQDSTGLLWISSTVQGVHNWDGDKVTTLHKGSSENYFPIKEGVQFGLRADGNILMSDWGYTLGRIF